MENIIQADGPDVTKGDRSTNVLDGAKGADVIMAMGRADIIDGGAGQDFFVLKDGDFQWMRDSAATRSGTITDFNYTESDMIYNDISSFDRTKVVSIDDLFMHL